MLALQFIPPSVVYSTVPPLPETLPREILPGVSTQLVHELLTIARLPVGGAGGIQVPGIVEPTKEVKLLQPLLAKTLDTTKIVVGR